MAVQNTNTTFQAVPEVRNGRFEQADQVVAQVECLQLGQLAQGWRQCHHTHIPDLVIVEVKPFHHGHRPFGEGRGEGGGGLISDL